MLKLFRLVNQSWLRLEFHHFSTVMISRLLSVAYLKLRGVHKLYWQDFGFSWPPTLCVDIFYVMNVDKKWTFLDHLPRLVNVVFERTSTNILMIGLTMTKKSGPFLAFQLSSKSHRIYTLIHLHLSKKTIWICNQVSRLFNIFKVW